MFLLVYREIRINPGGGGGCPLVEQLSFLRATCRVQKRDYPGGLQGIGTYIAVQVPLA